MTTGPHQPFRPAPVDRRDETKPVRSVRGHRYEHASCRPSPPPDEDDAPGRETCRASAPATSIEARTPPEVFLG